MGDQRAYEQRFGSFKYARIQTTRVKLGSSNEEFGEAIHTEPLPFLWPDLLINRNVLRTNLGDRNSETRFLEKVLKQTRNCKNGAEVS